MAVAIQAMHKMNRELVDQLQVERISRIETLEQRMQECEEHRKVLLNHVAKKQSNPRRPETRRRRKPPQPKAEPEASE